MGSTEDDVAYVKKKKSALWKGHHIAQTTTHLKTTTLAQGRWQLHCSIRYTTFFFLFSQNNRLQKYFNYVLTNEEKHTIIINLAYNRHQKLWQQKSTVFSDITSGDTEGLQRIVQIFLSSPVKKNWGGLDGKLFILHVSDPSQSTTAREWECVKSTCLRTL